MSKHVSVTSLENDLPARLNPLNISAAHKPTSALAQRWPVEKIVSDFQAGHGWTSGGSGTWNLNQTADFYAGTQCIEGATLGAGVDTYVQSPVLSVRNWTNVVFQLPFKVVSGFANLYEIRILLSGDAFANNASLRLLDGNSTSQTFREGEWSLLRFTLADITSQTGAPDLTLANRFRINIRDKGAGAATVRFGKLSTYTPNPAYPTGAVTLWFDDTDPSHSSIVAPYLARYGYAGVMAVINEKVGATYITLARVRELIENYGWEAAGHASTVAAHNAIGTFTAADMQAECIAIKEFFAANGLGPCNHYAYPLGTHNATIEAVLQRYFSTGRTTKASPVETMLPGQRMRTRVFSVNNTTTLAQFTAAVDKAHRAGVWLQVLFHFIVADGTADSSVKTEVTLFKQMIDYLATKGSRVMTVSDVWDTGTQPQTMITQSANGTNWQVSAGDDGALTTTAL